MTGAGLKQQVDGSNMIGKRPWAAGASIVLVAFIVLAGWIAARLPIEVPDTSSPPNGNHVGTVNDQSSVGQSFVAERDGLSQLSLILAVDQPAVRGEIILHLRERVDGEPIRSVKRPVSELREGSPMRMTPGLRTEHWETFGFDPIADSGGRKYYLSIQGQGLQAETSAKVLAFFHSRYPQGEAHFNGEQVNAHLAFRASSEGTMLDLLSVLVRNLTHNRPGVLSSGVLYVGLVAVYLVLTLILLGVARRATRPSG